MAGEDLFQNQRAPWLTLNPTAIGSVTTPPDSGDVRFVIDPDDNKFKWTDSAGADHELGVQKSIAVLTNKSGGGVIAGDVVIIDTSNDTAFTTTTSAAATGIIGIAQETIADNAAGDVLTAGYAALVLTSASVTRGNFAETHTVAKQATENATIQTGSFAQFLTGGATPTAWLFGTAVSGTGGGASLTVTDESATVSDTAVTSITVPDGSLVDDGVGLVTLKEVPTGVIGAKVKRTTAQGILTSTYDQAEFDTTPIYDTDGIWDAANDRFTVPTGLGGKWRFTFYAYMVNAGSQYVTFYKNGTAVGPQYRLDAAGAATGMTSVDLELVAGDYIEAWVYSSGGGNISDATYAHLQNVFSCEKLGSGNVAGLDTDSHTKADGDVTMNSTTWADVDTATDLTVPAQAGDVLLVSLSARAGSENVNACLDAATLVSSSEVNYISGGGGASDLGVQGWLFPAIGALEQTVGTSVQYTVVSGDLENNAVTLRLRYRTTVASNRTLQAGTAAEPLQWSVVNLRQASQRGELKGTAFPTSPATNERYIRTDIDGGVEFFYDGSRWLTTQIHESFLGAGTASASAVVSRVPVGRTGYSDTYITDWTVTFNAGATNDASNSFDYILRKLDSAVSPTTVSTIPSDSYTDSQINTVSNAVDALVGSFVWLDHLITMTGSPTSQLYGAVVRWRLVAT